MAGLKNKLKNLWKPPEDELEYSEEDSYYDNSSADDGAYETDEEYGPVYEEEAEPVSQPAPQKRQQVQQRTSQSGGSKIVNINPSASRLTVKLCKPERFGEETRDIAVEFMHMHAILLNLENTNKDMARRILDFLSGVAYANEGKISRVASNTYMIAPKNVDLGGDEVLDELENSGIYM